MGSMWFPTLHGRLATSSCTDVHAGTNVNTGRWGGEAASRRSIACAGGRLVYRLARSRRGVGTPTVAGVGSTPSAAPGCRDRFRRAKGPIARTCVTKRSLRARLVTHVGNAPVRPRGFGREGLVRTGVDRTDHPLSP